MGKQSVGVIGVGRMGLPFARHIMNAGFRISAYDVSDEAAEPLKGEAAVVSSPAEVAESSDVVIVMVATDQQTRDVVSGENGILSTAREGTVIVLCSTLYPEVCAELEATARERGVRLIDAPVVLGQRAAEEGRVIVLAGGEESALEECRPVLEAFSKDVIYLGAIGSGQIGKMINNMILWATIVANYEALTLARNLGADLTRLREALPYTSGDSWAIRNWDAINLTWYEKDLDAALDIAQNEKTPLPLYGLVDQLIKLRKPEELRALK